LLTIAVNRGCWRAGRWAGREVAIKCIEHDSETSKAVENEVQLMLAMDHTNIVKAYHYVTYRCGRAHVLVQLFRKLVFLTFVSGICRRRLFQPIAGKVGMLL
jgi:hypothetical protein